MRKHMSVLLVLGCVWSKTAAAEPAPKKPASHHHRTTARASRAKATPDSKPDFAKAPPPPRDESRVMLDLLSKVDGDLDDATLMKMAQRAVEKRVRARFTQLDKNHDDRIARAEVPKMNALRFSRFDVNHDAFITVGELGSVMRNQCAERVQQLVAKYDVDRDGRVTQAELAPAEGTDTRLAKLGTQPQAADTRPAVEKQ